jgi:hypothetical protein
MRYIEIDWGIMREHMRDEPDKRIRSIASEASNPLNVMRRLRGSDMISVKVLSYECDSAIGW